MARASTRSAAVCLIALALIVLAGCDTLRRHGIGGEPARMCRDGKLYINDRLVGADESHLSWVRRFKDADAACPPAVPASGAGSAAK